MSRYLKCSVDVGIHLRRSIGRMAVKVYTDTDWAGDKLTGKSKSSLAMFT